ncbi:MAG TPA: hypothetical protein DCL43_06245 [Chitinophagaceae bacterium]|nr:hypothetical protein [Chitinophagaceae bacterium]HAN39039.1 hypothetical protein [Chitinophagaceae bacterium]
MLLKKISTWGTAALAGAIVLAACERDYESVQVNNTQLGDRAYLKIINSTINSARNFISIDGARLNGAALLYSNTSAFSVSLFPQQNSGAYAAVRSGTVRLVMADTLTTSTQPAYNQSVTLNPNTYYTLFSYDTVNAAKYLLIQDNFPSFFSVDTTAAIRFANFMHAPAAANAPNVDFVSARMGLLASNVPLTGVTPFNGRFRANITDTLFVRPTGTSTNLYNFTINALPRRSYTIVWRGRFTNTTAYNASTNGWGRHFQIVTHDVTR